MSEDRSFDLSTALFHVTLYRKYAWKVGTSANSALIRYYLPRLKLSIALLSRKRGNEHLVLVNRWEGIQKTRWKESYNRYMESVDRRWGS